MPAKQQKVTAQKQASPRSTAKYTSRDGSKFITVPKGDPSESSQPSTPTSSKPGEQLASATPEQASGPAVNRKKQKRRAKAAAKAAAQAQANGHPTPSTESSSRHEPADYEEVPSDEDEDYEYILASEAAANCESVDSESKSKKGKKKKTKPDAIINSRFMAPFRPITVSGPLPAPGPGASGISRDKIWSNGNIEERERIKQFWLNLGEDERKSLVKVEKDAVLRKMKEQQKHTCSCTVCGRKRNAIEEELEGLYDAYYVELEEFANQGESPSILPPSRDFPSHSFRSEPAPHPLRPPPVGRMVEPVPDVDEEDDYEEEGYSDDEVEDDEYSDDEPPEAYHNPHDRDVADFLTFGNSLQVKGTQLLEKLLRRYGNMDLGGILTVADDLLKNDGKRFIEMMEQLAERRMAREEDARGHFARGYGHPNGPYSNPHTHSPPVDDDYEDEDEEEEEGGDEEDGEFDDSQDEEYEGEQDPMTEEQRMEEGRRMFQIFAARMFEQRVLSAYKEKVAKERQEKLIEELEEETRKEDRQKAKRAKNAAKKKEKAAQKKQAQAEEKARKEAEKAAEEAARIEAEKQKAAEAKRKLEEKRREKEAQRKADEEAKLKKEAERQRRIHEQQERQAEQERKAREAKDKEKKVKEEQRRQEKETRERKELEAQERKDKQERDKRDKEARAAKAQKDAQELREAKEKAKEEKAAQKAAAAAVASPPSGPSNAPSQPAVPVQPSPVLSKRSHHHPAAALPQHPPNPASFVSPKIPVATPIVPKAPTPIRLRTASQQHDGTSSTSQSASVASQNASPHPDTASQSSPGPVGPSRKDSSASGFPSHPSQSVSPQSNGTMSRGAPSAPQFPPMGMAPPGLGVHHPPPPGFPGQPQFPPGFRYHGNMMMPPPGINGLAGRGFAPAPMPPPGFGQGAPEPFPLGQAFSMPKEGPMPPPGHARQGSIGFDGAPGTPLQPGSRPVPIGRPGSNVSGRSKEDKGDGNQHLGSRALLEDDDMLPSEPINIHSQPPGPRPSFAPSPFMETGFMGHNMWASLVGGHSFPSAPPGLGGNPNWGAPGLPSAFGSTPNKPNNMGLLRGQTGLVAVRNLLVQTYRDLANSGHADAEGYVDFDLVRQHTEARSGELNVSAEDLIVLTETEGNATNGGGTFDARADASRGGVEVIRWLPDGMGEGPSLSGSIGAPGQIGSPIVRPAATVSSRGA